MKLKMTLLLNLVVLAQIIYLRLDSVTAQRPPAWPCQMPFPCKTDDRYGIPEDCTKFLMCGAGGRHYYTLDCPSGLHFDTTTDDCLFPHEAACQKPCGTTRESTVATTAAMTTVPTTVPTTTPNPTTVAPEQTTQQANWPCNVPRPCVHQEVYGDPDDCTQFYICYNNGRNIDNYKCPGTLRFDAVDKDCVDPDNARCEPPCQGSGELVHEEVKLTGSIQRPAVVAFSVSSSSRELHLNDGQTLVFDDLDLDTWYGYSQNRGSYVCPHTGNQFYQFNLNIKFNILKNKGKLEVMKSKQTLATITASSDVTGSHVIITECHYMEEVKVVCHGNCHLQGNRQTIFSGYMLK